MEDIPFPLGLAMILGIIIKMMLDRFDRVTGSAMTEDGVARSKPPQYQFLGAGVVLFFGSAADDGSLIHFPTTTQVSPPYGSHSPSYSSF